MVAELRRMAQQGRGSPAIVKEHDTKVGLRLGALGTAKRWKLGLLGGSLTAYGWRCGKDGAARVSEAMT